MDISRRQFIFASTAGAYALAAGCITNPAPVFDAGVDNCIPLPGALAETGSQIKVKLPSIPEPVLVVHTKIGYNGTAGICTNSSQTELQYSPTENLIKCLGCSSEYALDGTVVRGPARRPLKAYVVDLQGDKLKILG